MKYTFYVRSFHPDENFGPTGLGFLGDNRGYSNSPSGATSRIWYFVEFDLEAGTLIDYDAYSSPSGWIIGGETAYDPDSDKGPWEETVLDHSSNTNNIYQLSMHMHYWGINRAMPDLAHFAVPDLDTHFSLRILVDKERQAGQITGLMRGDGFPNAEAFLIDGKDQSLFLCTHERFGTAMAGLQGDRKLMMAMCDLTLDFNPDGTYKGKDILGFALDQTSIGPKQFKANHISLTDWNQLHTERDPSPWYRDLKDWDITDPIQRLGEEAFPIIR